MGCQKEIAKVMTDQEADDVLALKENHPTLYEDVTQFFGVCPTFYTRGSPGI